MSKDKIFSKAPKVTVKATPRRSTYLGLSSYNWYAPLIDLTQFEILKNGTILEIGDEYYYRPRDEWFETQCVGQKVDCSEIYRRRLRIR